MISDQEKYIEALEYNTRFHIKKDFPNSLMIKEGTCNHYFIILNNKRINGCMYYWEHRKVHNIKLYVKPKDIYGYIEMELGAMITIKNII